MARDVFCIVCEGMRAGIIQPTSEKKILEMCMSTTVLLFRVMLIKMNFEGSTKTPTSIYESCNTREL